MSDHPRDCPHGRQWGKCDTCDLIEANAHIAALEAENERLEAAYMDMGARAAGFEYTVRHYEEEIGRLRAVVEAAREGCDACHKYNGADYCCDCYHAGSGTHDALAALEVGE